MNMKQSLHELSTEALELHYRCQALIAECEAYVKMNKSLEDVWNQTN